MSFSLRELLVAFAIVAAGLAAMLSGSPAIASVFVFAGWLAVVAAAIGAILSKGRWRAFCIGFALSAAILHFMALRDHYALFYEHGDWVESPINHLLDYVYAAQFPDKAAELWGSKYLPNLPPPIVGDEISRDHARAYFRVGQMGFLLALAYIGGKFATLVYRKHHPPPEKTTE